MFDLRLVDADPDNLPLLQAGLAALSADLGDVHRVDEESLGAVLFGPYPACHGLLALRGDDTVLGAALFSPVVSTTTGGAGAYVSDLWVSEGARGSGLGRKLLGGVVQRAQAMWRARFVRLVSYGANSRARAFYARLGFEEKDDELVLQLSGYAMDELDR